MGSAFLSLEAFAASFDASSDDFNSEGDVVTTCTGLVAANEAWRPRGPALGFKPAFTCLAKAHCSGPRRPSVLLVAQKILNPKALKVLSPNNLNQ